MRSISERLVLAVVLVSSLQSAKANTEYLGYIAFSNLIPGAPGAPGVNVFSLNNFTGDPLLGGFAVPPTFQSLTPVTFLSSTLTLVAGGLPQVISLGSLGPGSFTPVPLQFADTVDFDSAVFSAVLNTTTFQLADGTTFQATSPAISVNLLPSTGPFLAADIDFGLIAVNGSPAVVPEPAPVCLLLVALPFLRRWLLKRHVLA